MIKPWLTTTSKKLGDFRVFSIRTDHKTSPRTGAEHDFFVLECPNWVNVIATTSAGELVMVEQFRHGTNTVELEIPGGVTDPADASPEATGLRELREETGYAGEPPRIIGKTLPNPAIMSNTCYTVLIENCRHVHEVQFDQAEDIITRLVPIADIPALVAEGKIQHSLVIVALYHFELYRQQECPG